MKALLLAAAILLAATPVLATDLTYTQDCADGCDDANDEWYGANGDEIEAAVDDNDARIDALLTTDTCTTPPCDLTSGTTLGGAAVQTGTDDDVPESGDFGAAGDLEADGTLSDDTVAAAEMADADHGDVSWSGGVATVEAGDVDTAAALASNGSNCSAGSYPLGVDASGAVETCTDATTEIDAALDAFVHCVSGGLSSPDNTDRVTPGLPFAVTITGLYCTVGGTTPSITLALEECDSAGANCADGGISLTCDGGIDSDTSFTDAAFDSGDGWNFNTGAASGTVDYLSWRVCYTR